MGTTPVVRGGTERTSDAVRSAALPRANAGLDYLSARGVADVVISDADDHTIVWALDDGRATMRVTAMAPISAELRMSGTVTDANGTVVQQPVPGYQRQLRLGECYPESFADFLHRRRR